MFCIRCLLFPIEEEAGAYLENQKSVEDVSEIIQSRITMYLQESVD